MGWDCLPDGGQSIIDVVLSLLLGSRLDFTTRRHYPSAAAPQPFFHAVCIRVFLFFLRTRNPVPVGRTHSAHPCAPFSNLSPLEPVTPDRRSCTGLCLRHPCPSSHTHLTVGTVTVTRCRWFPRPRYADYICITCDVVFLF